MRTWKTSMFAAVLFIGDSHSYQSFGRKLDELLRTLPNTQVATYASWGSSPASWFESWITEHGYFERGFDGGVVDEQNAPTPTPMVGDLLARLHPTLTIVALGSNLYGAPTDYASQTARQLADTLRSAGSLCLWVGPPDMRERGGPAMDSLIVTLRESAKNCGFMDSRVWTQYPATGGDGIHYDYLGAEGTQQTEAWARQVFECARWIENSGVSNVR